MSALTLTRSQRYELRRLKAEFYSESEHAFVKHDKDRGFTIVATPAQSGAYFPKFYHVAFAWLSPRAMDSEFDPRTGEYFALSRLARGEHTTMETGMLFDLVSE